ncbi:hypothetical protein PENTCL1PPCAC_23106 [Pristionchus entomophagus]|uniref:G protein-coupled receptor n=1 Tax=Pristionchus entomophagus TaxID=358040 RepID=A0AAV5U352_9BILA|nr:hypothetical protein PENTCL1PPCAC_23106 [Pristionchus entomophagus]
MANISNNTLQIEASDTVFTMSFIVLYMAIVNFMGLIKFPMEWLRVGDIILYIMVIVIWYKNIHQSMGTSIPHPTIFILILFLMAGRLTYALRNEIVKMADYLIPFLCHPGSVFPNSLNDGQKGEGRNHTSEVAKIAGWCLVYFFLLNFILRRVFVFYRSHVAKKEETPMSSISQIALFEKENESFYSLHPESQEFVLLL